MNSEIKEFEKLLKKNKYYVTKARLRLFSILQNNSALTIHELIELLSKHDQATVYRNIKILEQLGVLARLQLGWHSKLELSDMFRHHHHHLTCIHCGHVTVLKEDQLIEQRITELSRSRSFQPTDHQLEIRGICHQCQRKI